MKIREKKADGDAHPIKDSYGNVNDAVVEGDVHDDAAINDMINNDDLENDGGAIQTTTTSMSNPQVRTNTSISTCMCAQTFLEMFNPFLRERMSQWESKKKKFDSKVEQGKDSGEQGKDSGASCAGENRHPNLGIGL